MAKHTSIEVIKNLYISPSGIQFKSNNSELIDIPGIRFNDLSGCWEYNNGNEEWLPIGAGKNDVFYSDEFPSELPTEPGIYINADGESKYFTGEDWILISHELISTISEESYSESNITSEKAVIDYVADVTRDFITSSVVELTNFYTKSQIDEKNYITSSVTDLYNFYNKSEINNLLSGVDPQHIFIVDNTPVSGVPNSIYVLSNTKQTFISDDNGILSSISYQAITDLSQHTTDNTTLPTCKAVADYVSDSTKNYITSSVAELQNFYTKSDITGNYYTNAETSSLINQKVAGLFKFCGVCSAAELNNKEKIAGNVWQISGLDVDGSTGAEYACNTSGQWIKLGYTIDLSNYILTGTIFDYTKDISGKPNLNIYLPSATFAETSGKFIQFSIDNELPTTGLLDNVLYLTPSGEVGVVINNQLTNLSIEIIDDISQYANDNTVIPGVKAVVDYVSGIINDLPIDDVQHIFYVDSLPQSKRSNSIYVLSGINQTFITDENNNVYNLSYEISEGIYPSSTNDTIPGTKAVYDYITGLAISTFNNDAGYITNSVNNLQNYYTKADITGNYYTNAETSSLINQKVAGLFKFCGVCTKAELNNKEKIAGNVWQISGLDSDGSTDAEYACNTSGQWIKLGYTIDLSNYILTGTIFDYNTDISGKPDLNIYLPSATFAEISSKFVNFSIDNNIPTTGLLDNVLYLTPSGEVAALISGQLTELSIKAITDLHQHMSDNDTIPTCKAVVDYIQPLTSGDVQHIFYVNELPSTPVKNSIYVISNTNQIFIIDNNSNSYSINYELVSAITNLSTNNVIPGAKAVYDYVSGATKNYITNSVNNLQNYYTKSDITSNYYTSAQVSALPITTFNNDAGYITNSVNNLQNYYTKSDITGNYYTANQTTSLINQKISGLFKFCGVCTKAELENKEKIAGNVWQISGLDVDGSTDAEYACNTSGEWIKLGYTINLSNYYDKDEITGNYYDKNTITGLISGLDPQHIFIVDSNTKPVDTEAIPNSIYVLSDTKQTYISDNDGMLSSISYEVISNLTINETNDNAIPTCKAVVDYIQPLTSGDVQHIFYETTYPVGVKKNSIYVLSGINNLSTYIIDDNNDIHRINHDIVSNIASTSTNDTIPGTKAVYDYVSGATKNYITSSVTELQNFYTKSDITGNYYDKNAITELAISTFNNDANYITSSVTDLKNFYNKDDIYDVIFDYTDNLSGKPDLTKYLPVSSFNKVSGNFALTGDILNKIEFSIDNELPTTNLSSNILYLTPSGEVGVVINNQLTPLSMEVITDLSQYISDNTTIPTCKAVADYVGQFSPGDEQHIYYVSGNTLPVSLVSNSIYVLSGTNQSFIVDNNNTAYNMSYELVSSITSVSTNDVIPGAKAVYDYVSGVIKDLPVGDVQHIFYVNGDELPQVKTSNSIYVLSGINQTFITDENNNVYNLSYEISEEIDSTSTNDTIPGTKAVYDYVNNHSGSNSKTYLEIKYNELPPDCSISGKLLIIAHGLNTELPFVQIYITENNSYTLTNIPYIIAKDTHNVIIDYTGYENKLISVKIME